MGYEQAKASAAGDHITARFLIKKARRGKFVAYFRVSTDKPPPAGALLREAPR